MYCEIFKDTRREFRKRDRLQEKMKKKYERYWLKYKGIGNIKINQVENITEDLKKSKLVIK